MRPLLSSSYSKTCVCRGAKVRRIPPKTSLLAQLQRRAMPHAHRMHGTVRSRSVVPFCLLPRGVRNASPAPRVGVLERLGILHSPALHQRGSVESRLRAAGGAAWRPMLLLRLSGQRRGAATWPAWHMRMPMPPRRHHRMRRLEGRCHAILLCTPPATCKNSL